MMKKLFFSVMLCMIVGLFAAPAHAGVPALTNFLNSPGSLLAYPLIDNIHGVTIVNIANTGRDDAIVECYMVTHGLDGTIDEKKDFVIKLTPKEKFVWITSKPYNQRANQIQGFDNRKGYMFCFAIDNEYDQREITWNYLKGDATVLNLVNASAFNYNAIPHQRIPRGINAIVDSQEVMPGDRILALDGYEYTMATSQIMFEGLAEVKGAIYGTLAVASPGRAVFEEPPPCPADDPCDGRRVVESDYDFILSKQPAFDINLYCWNEVETKFSRHLTFKDFEQYDLTKDLQLDIHSIFSLGFHCATTSTHPLWAVFHQNLAGVFGWGGNVFQPIFETGVPAAIILPPVPMSGSGATPTR